ncbi:MAG TPA: branched-chain amino acid ABC transporter substrate-binding protein [Azospirillaceae bacterium]|nr:branched-chain amino acid ABC transporter substrate-binding protein [Azospirillaceae bacterium]
MKAAPALFSAIALAVPVAVAPVSGALAEPLRVAIIESLSGGQTSTGRPNVLATNYVVDKVNAAGGFNGEKIVVTEYDNGGNTAGASAKFKQALADGVHVVIQGSSSAIAGQISEDVRKHNLRNPGREVLYLNVGAEAMELTGEKCHFHSFRFTTTAPMRVDALVKVMKEEGTLGSRIYSINQNYSWGQDVETAIKSSAKAGGYGVVEAVLHEVNRIQDFAPFVAKIQAAKPDTVITGNWSNDLLLLMKAAGNAGLKARFATMFLDQIGNIGNAGQLALGHYVAHTYNPEATGGVFAQDYKSVTGHIPAYVEPTTVNAVRMLIAALQTVTFGGGAIDINKVALALENTTLETDMGTQAIRKEDHQTQMPIVVSRVEAGVKYPVDGTNLGFQPIKVLPAEEVLYPVQVSCRMVRPQ